MKKSYTFNNQLESYPIVLIPLKIQKNLDLKLDKNQVCKELNIKYPVLSLRYKVNEPSKYKRIDKKSMPIDQLGCLVILLIPFIYYLVNGLLTNDYVGFWWTILIFFMLWLPLSQVFNGDQDSHSVDVEIDEKTYEKLYAKFLSDKNEVEIENNKREEVFKMQKAKIDVIISESYDEIRTKYHYNSLKSEVKIRTLENDIRGKSELFFLDKLYSKFGNQIHVDIVPDDGINRYQPDFVLVCEESKLHIDIEIDEPYSVINGQNIHNERSNDNIRNSYFEEINWIVIRFSEKQIIEDANECCNLIDSVIKNLKGMNDNYNHNIKLDKKWTHEESLIMMSKNYRNSYLPNNMKILKKYY